MLDWPRPPEGRLQEQINYLFDLLWKITEEINLLEGKLNDQSRD